MSGDLKLAVRRLIASPLFVIFAVASLALGVGVTVTGYAVIESLFWRPLGVTSPERVAVVTVPARGSRAWRQRLSQLDFAELQTQQRVFSRVAAVTTFSSSLAGEGGLEFIRGEAVRPGFFDVIGHGNPIRGMKMADFARSIESGTDRITVDKTGLEGFYAFTLRYTGTPSPDSDVHSLFTALQEQPGLRLRAATAQVRVLVIDISSGRQRTDHGVFSTRAVPIRRSAARKNRTRTR